MPKAKRNAKEEEQHIIDSLPAKEKLFKLLCKHVSDGFSYDCFPYCSDKLLNTLFRDFPAVFCQETFNNSLKQGKLAWEDIGRRQANGSCMGNSRAWVYNMINRYRWSDKLEVSADVKGKLDVSIVNYGSPTSLS
jgi:hypothetical protein